jgi:radical SAM-linked protein
MASESPQNQPSGAAALAARPHACDKARIRFSKSGLLRFVSHRDLMKCFERVLRRSALPIHYSSGFHPMPRMVFAMSLGLGITGLSEVLELEFDEPVEPCVAARLLAAHMPPGLEIVSFARVSVQASAQVRRVGYRATIPAELLPGLPARVKNLLCTRVWWIERSRPTPRRFDLRPLLSELSLEDNQLEMLLWVAPSGVARPDEVLSALALTELVESGTVLQRHILELHDEFKE